MAGPARSGVLIYAMDLARMAVFYETVLAARCVHADAEHRVLQSDDAQLILHAIPEPHRQRVALATQAQPREDQAIKPFFTVPSLAVAEQQVLQAGGRVHGPLWPGPGMRVRNVCDPEGNVIHLREIERMEPA